MKKIIVILLSIIINTQLFAQANKLVTTTQKVMAEKAVQEYCKYVEEVAQGKSAGLAILKNLYIEQFANETWDDIETNELITFDKYFKKLQSKSPKVHFTKIPTRSDFLYYTTERKEKKNNIIKIPFIGAPVEKTINGKTVKGYVFVRATTFKITNYKPKMPDWPLIVDDEGEIFNKRVENIEKNQKVFKLTKISLDSKLLIPYRKGNKWGFCLPNKKIIISPQYDYVRPFVEGKAIIKKNNKYGIIDKKGNTIVSFMYDGIADFSEGLALVENKNKYGYINHNGKIVIPITFEIAESFKNGVAKVGFRDENKGLGETTTGLINRKGNWVVPIGHSTYGNYNKLSNGLIWLRETLPGSTNIKAINSNGDTIISLKGWYDSPTLFSNGYCWVKKQGKNWGWYVINKKGEIVYKLKHQTGNPSNVINEGLSWFEEWKKFYLIDINNNTKKKIKVDKVKPFSDGVAWVKKNNKWGVIDKNGKILIDFKYDFKYSPDPFMNGFSNIENGIIDKKGKVYPFTILSFISNEDILNNDCNKYKKEVYRAREVINGKTRKWGVVDNNLKIVVPFVYDYINYISEDLIVAKKNNKYNLINTQGKIVKSLGEYWRIESFENGVAKVWQDVEKEIYPKLLGYIGKDGTMYWED